MCSRWYAEGVYLEGLRGLGGRGHHRACGGCLERGEEEREGGKCNFRN